MCRSSNNANAGEDSWPPGTVLLDDMQPGNDQIILQPRPSDDPNDPLNWVKWRKYLNFGLACLYVVTISECINVSTPTWEPMNIELGFSYDMLNNSYAAGCASLGVGAILLIPFALKFGRRPLYVLSTLVQLGVSIWAAKMTTVADLMLTNIVQCLFGALAEVIVQMTIADLFFVHQRGTANSLYIWSWALAASIGPLIGGFITDGQGWRWVWWWNAIFFAVVLFVVFFGYEETKYVLPASSSALESAYSHDGAENTQSPPSPIAKSHGSETHDLGTRRAKDYTPNLVTKSVEEGIVLDAYKVHLNPAIPLKTYRQRLALTATTSSNGGGLMDFLCHMYNPLVLLTTIPAIAFVAMIYGVLVGLGDVMSTTTSTYMSKPPYNFTASQIGLMSMPRLIGSTIGTLIVGPVSDRLIVRLARRNKGVYDPEVRLWAVLPFVMFIPAGALLYGIGLNNGLPWPVCAFGLVIYWTGIAPVNSISITYLTDSYKDIIGDALVGVTVVRNTFSTVFIFALSPWVRAVGIKWCLVTIVLIVCLVLANFVIFIIWGRKFRARSAERYRYYATQQYKERVL